MYSTAEYTYLKKKYGGCSSWAIWDNQNQQDTTVIDKSVAQLSSTHVFAALNISKELMKDQAWTNFRSGKHDRKLKYACNDTALRGSYLTDLFKGIPEPKASKIEDLLTPEIIQRHVEAFHSEMNDVELNEHSTFIILGDMARRYFEKYFRQGYSKNRIIYYCHYSFYGMTDKQWTEGLWHKLNIVQDFDLIARRYKHGRT